MAPKTNDPLALIQYLQGNSGSGSAAKDLNYQQDILSTLFNPQYGAANDMYDPLSLTPAPFQFATPVLTGALNSATPIWQEVAQAIMSGTIDRQNAISAVAEALGVDEYSTGAGLTIADVKSQIDSMFKEAGDKQNAEFKYQEDVRNSEQSNVYGKAGLPQPTEEYTLETMPISSDLQNMFARLQSQKTALSSKASEAKGATKLAKARMLAYAKDNPTTVDESAPVVNPIPNSESDVKALAKKLNISEQWLLDRWREDDDTWIPVYEGNDIVSYRHPTAIEKRDSWLPKMESILKTTGNPALDKPDQINRDRAKAVLGYKSAGGLITGLPVSAADKRETQLMTNRAASNSADTLNAEKEYRQMKNMLARASATMGNKQIGELLALQLANRTPLSDALNERAMGLTGR
jgi:hypothetical protein